MTSTTYTFGALVTYDRHYHDHLWPIIEALRSRGHTVHDITSWQNADFGRYMHPKDLGKLGVEVWLTAGAKDAKAVPGRTIYLEHGAGQCLVPETKVLRADLRWVPVGHLVVGDEIIGFNEHAEGKGRPRQWERTTVTATRPLVMPCYRITMTDGTVITASENHLWLRRMNGHHEWMRTDALQDRARWPKRASKLLRLFDVWDEDRSWGGGYLAAAFDGEGSFTQTVRDEARQNRMMLAFTQKGNAMLALAKIELRARGFDYREDHHAASGVTHLAIRGGTREVMRFLGSIRPRRLLDNFVPLDRGKMLGEAVEVAEVVPVGDRVVIGLTTSSGTLIAEGFASHNTYEADARGAGHESYSTGRVDNAAGFLCPNLFVRSRRAKAHPGVPAVAVGSPRLDHFPVGQHDGVERAVAFTFHWHCELVPETRSAFDHFLPHATAIALGLRRGGMLPVAHGHPRIAKRVRWHLERHGFEWWDYDDVLTKAAVLVADNTSALYEFAHVDRPIVVLNAPEYRKHVHHGLRFWDCVPGEQVDDPAELVDAVRRAYREDPCAVERARCAELVFPLQDGFAALRAAVVCEAIAGQVTGRG